MGQPYTKTAWVAGAPPAITATRLNNIETGIYVASSPVVTSLPTSPVDGQECHYVADATNGVVWHLVYRTVSGRWHYVGGPPLYSEVMNGGNGYPANLSGAWGDLGATNNVPGPTVVVPLLGDYIFRYGFYNYFSNIGNANPVGRMTPSIAGVNLGDQESVVSAPGFAVPAGQQHMHNDSRDLKRSNVAAGATILMKFKYENAAPVICDNRWLEVTPIRVG